MWRSGKWRSTPREGAHAKRSSKFRPEFGTILRFWARIQTFEQILRLYVRLRMPKFWDFRDFSGPKSVGFLIRIWHNFEILSSNSNIWADFKTLRPSQNPRIARFCFRISKWARFNGPFYKDSKTPRQSGVIGIVFWALGPQKTCQNRPPASRNRGLRPAGRPFDLQVCTNFWQSTRFACATTGQIKIHKRLNNLTDL